MAQEIERKFLVSGDFKSFAFAQSRIMQGYICSARGRTVRVRIRDDKGYLTIKGASNESGTSRYEWEKELPLSEAEELMKLCEPEDEAFVKPGFIGEEVTGDIRYYNSHLMKKPYKTW